MKTAWWVLGLLISVAGCAGVERLELDLRGNNGPLGYLYDSEKISEKQPVTLRVGSVTVDDVLPEYTNVKAQSGFVIPLLVLNFWKYEYQSSLGYAQVTNDYKTFIKESFVEEVRRSGKFTCVEGEAEMEIDLRIKAITMSAPLRKVGSFIFAVYAISYSQSIFAGPADVQVTADVIVRKQGHELFNHEVHGFGRSGVLNGGQQSVSQFTTAMIEALSFALKGLNQTIVTEINRI